MDFPGAAADPAPAGSTATPDPGTDRWTLVATVRRPTDPRETLRIYQRRP